MEKLKRIAAIHDLSGLGKCSLTVALPVISASGVECSCIPTAVLSTHTGGFQGYTLKDLNDEMLPIARHWSTVGAEFDGVYSGYLASPQQAIVVRQIIDLLSKDDTKVIVDPVMADNGEYYSNLGEDMCCAFRELCGIAHVITPNITEAALLCDMEYKSVHEESYIQGLMKCLSDICPGHVVITGVATVDGRLGNAALDRVSGEVLYDMGPARKGLFYGVGDLFASSLSALLVRGATLRQALRAASALVRESVRRTELRGAPRIFGAEFETALPGYIQSLREIFED